MRYTKAVSPEQLALERALATQEATVRQAFDVFLKGTHRALSLEKLTSLIESGNVDEALKIVNAYIVRLGNSIEEIFPKVGAAEAASLAAQLELSRLDVSFEPGNRAAAQVMRSNTLMFIKGFTEQQRLSTRAALVDSLTRGQGTFATARAFRNSIGLTQTQQAAVFSYWDALERRSVDALSRALRDRRFDPTVANAVDRGEPLTTTQIRRMVDRYRERMLALRAETIARTETLKVVNQARYESLQQVIDQSGIEPVRVERIWHATRDKRTRDSHLAMDGQTVGLDEAFTSGLGNRLMFPGDPTAPLEDFINCRCVVTTRINPAARRAVA